jgi:hypothetical protein
MYKVHIVNSDGASAGIRGLHPEVLRSFDNPGNAELFACREATLYEMGCAIVDTERRTIDWGIHPETGNDLETDYDGNPVNLDEEDEEE